MKRLDLTGQRFGRLIVLGPAPSRKLRGDTRLFWKCRCDCGTIKEIMPSSLRRGLTQSCGCLRREQLLTSRTKHGHCTGGHSPEAQIYAGAHQRCTNPSHISYRHYGGRGIEFKFTSFQEFIDEIGTRPSPELTLDRINNDGHYAPGNVRWATRLEQTHNRRAK